MFDHPRLADFGLGFVGTSLAQAASQVGIPVAGFYKRRATATGQRLPAYVYDITDDNTAVTRDFDCVLLLGLLEQSNIEANKALGLPVPDTRVVLPMATRL